MWTALVASRVYPNQCMLCSHLSCRSNDVSPEVYALLHRRGIYPYPRYRAQRIIAFCKSATRSAARVIYSVACIANHITISETGSGGVAKAVNSSCSYTHYTVQWVEDEVIDSTFKNSPPQSVGCMPNMHRTRSVSFWRQDGIKRSYSVLARWRLTRNVCRWPKVSVRFETLATPPHFATFRRMLAEKLCDTEIQIQRIGSAVAASL